LTPADTLIPASTPPYFDLQLIVAGLLKGTIGIGMPVVALPLLPLFIDVKSAAMHAERDQPAAPRRIRFATNGIPQFVEVPEISKEGAG
jgi:hypothetical protein